MVLFLHGSGERGIDPGILWKTGQQLSDSMATDLPAILLLPQCRPRANWQPKEMVDFLEHCRQHFRVDGFHGDVQRVHLFWHHVGNAALTLLSNLFTNLNLSDMECGYKAFRREVVLAGLTIQENRFGIETELVAKVARGGCMRCRCRMRGEITPRGKRSASRMRCGRCGVKYGRG